MIGENRPNIKDFNRPPVNEAVTRLSRVFADRIFIADALKESKADDDFRQLKGIVYYEQEEQDRTPIELRFAQTHLRDHEDKLRSKILELAKNDIVKFHFFGK